MRASSYLYQPCNFLCLNIVTCHGTDMSSINAWQNRFLMTSYAGIFSAFFNFNQIRGNNYSLISSSLNIIYNNSLSTDSFAELTYLEVKRQVLVFQIRWALISSCLPAYCMIKAFHSLL